MPTPKPPYPSEFRQQMVELVQAGRKRGPETLLTRLVGQMSTT
jgi:hypothetical protein